MSNILILNFNSAHDLTASAYLIGAIKTEAPQTNIELITNKEFEGIANVLSGVSKVHVLDTDLINNIYQNPLYSDAFAVNEFTKVITTLTEVRWDQIINYSNDNISSYLMSALDADQKIGSSINHKGSVICNSDWSLYQNYVASEQRRRPIDKITIRNQMLHLSLKNDYLKLKQDENYSLVAGQNFRKIREMKGSPGTFVIGINLEQSHNADTFNIDTLSDLIEAMEESSDYKPVLLLNGKNYQRSMANELNQRFNNSLISINIDIVALPSVIANLDGIISYSNNTLALADLLETKCIEVKSTKDKISSPLTITPSNYIIYAKDEAALSSDILLALNEEFGTELPIERMNSANPIYQAVEDDYGPFYTQIRGDLDIESELNYHLGRSFFSEIMGSQRNDSLIAHIKENTDKDILLKYVSVLRTELTNTVKLLLATLRSLKSMRNSESNLNNFISHLDNLITIGKTKSMVGDIVRLFEGRVENIEANNIDSNIKAIESHLFQLKKELQTLTNYLGELVKEQEATLNQLNSELQA